MRVATIFALLVPLWLFAGCGGKVVTEGGGGRGGGGGDGGDGGAPNVGGNPKDCPYAACSDDGQKCDCETTCTGPKLRAVCKIHDAGQVICECHYDGGYMGTCAPSSGPVCSLPDGCCEMYVP